MKARLAFGRIYPQNKEICFRLRTTAVYSFGCHEWSMLISAACARVHTSVCRGRWEIWSAQDLNPIPSAPEVDVLLLVLCLVIQKINRLVSLRPDLHLAYIHRRKVE